MSVGEPHFKLDPDRQRVRPEGLVIQSVGELGINRRRERIEKICRFQRRVSSARKALSITASRGIAVPNKRDATEATAAARSV